MQKKIKNYITKYKTNQRKNAIRTPTDKTSPEGEEGGNVLSVYINQGKQNRIISFTYF